MKITNAMSRQEKIAAAIEVEQKLKRITRSGMIMGGFPRDVHYDKVPKDIDLYIPLHRFPAEANRDAIADRLFAALGQTGRRMLDQEALDAYGNIAPTSEAFFVYECTSAGDQYQPLNIIFKQCSRAIECIHSFDFDICMYFMDNGPNAGAFRMNDNLVQVTSAPLSDPRSIQRCVEHWERIQRKYPQAVLRFSTVQLVNNLPLYQALFEGGYLNEAPTREVLSTEGQISSGDEVRLNTGTPVGLEAEFNRREQEQRARDALAAIRARAQSRGAGLWGTSFLSTTNWVG